MLDSLSASTDRAALEQYGIKVVDVRIKRLNLPEQNKQSVYARMRAERERIARQYRAEGEEQALEHPRRRRSPARGDPLAGLQAGREDKGRRRRRIHADLRPGVFARIRKLYKLLRTLDSYKKVIDDKTTAILSSDSELLKVLTRGESGAQ